MSIRLPNEILERIYNYVPKDKDSKCAYDLTELKTLQRSYSNIKSLFQGMFGIEFDMIQNPEAFSFSKYVFNNSFEVDGRHFVVVKKL